MLINSDCYKIYEKITGRYTVHGSCYPAIVAHWGQGELCREQVSIKQLLTARDEGEAEFWRGGRKAVGWGVARVTEFLSVQKCGPLCKNMNTGPQVRARKNFICSGRYTSGPGSWQHAMPLAPNTLFAPSHVINIR